MSTVSMFLGQRFDSYSYLKEKKIDVIQSKTKNGLLNKIKN